MMAIIDRLRTTLASRRIVLVTALLAIVLTLPSLRVGWLFDDYFHQLVLRNHHLLTDASRSRWDMFRFINGDPQQVRHLMDVGFLPWWTWPHIRGAFWRPVTVATHWLDYRLWPEWPSLMHAQSILWYGLLAGAAAWLYRRVIGPTWIAGLAAVLYAVDDAHGLPAGWLANRNAIIAAFFGVATLIAHDHWRRGGKLWAGLLAPVLLVLSVLAGEAGVGTCAYLFAYAVFLEGGRGEDTGGQAASGTKRRTRGRGEAGTRGKNEDTGGQAASGTGNSGTGSSGTRRLLSLLPYALVIVVWRIAWTMQGYGVSGMGLYTDPVDEPLRFLAGVAWKAPLLLLGQWAAPPADLTLIVNPRQFRFLLGFAVVLLVGLAVLLAPTVRRSRAGRFWACGMLLSVLPICATFPSDRLLGFVGIGAMGLLAMFLGSVFPQASEAQWSRPSRWVTIPAGILILVHLVIAPLALPVRAGGLTEDSRLIRALDVRTPFDESVKDQAVIVVNAPSTFNVMFMPMVRLLKGLPVPKAAWVLAPAVPSVTVGRPDERSLLVAPASGYVSFMFEVLFRDRHPFRVGDRVELAGMTVEITAMTKDGRPAEALFRFDVPLENRSLRWLCYKDGEFVPFTPPGVGQTVVLRAHWPW